MSTSMFIPAENSPLYDPNTPQHNWYELATTPDRPPIAFSPDTLNDITELRFIHELPQRQTQIYGEDFRVSTRLNVQPETNPILVKLQQTYFESSLYPDRDYTATTGVITKSINSCCCTSSHRNGTCAANHDDNDQPLEQSNPLCFSEVTTKNIRTRTATTAKKFTTNTSSITIGNRTTTQIPSNKTSTTNLGNNETIRHGNTTTKNHTNHLNTAPNTTTTTIYDDNEDDIFLFDVDDVVFRTTQIPEKIHHNTEDDVNIIHNVTSDAEPAADDEPDMVIDNDDDEVDNDDDYVNDDDDDDTHNNPTNDIVKTINCFNATIDTYDTLGMTSFIHPLDKCVMYMVFFCCFQMQNLTLTNGRKLYQKYH